MNVINCKAIADEWLEITKQRAANLRRAPRLCIISLGEPDERSKVYIRNKIRACKKVGIYYSHVICSETEPAKVLSFVKNMSESYDACMVQMPFGISSVTPVDVAYNISPDADCDGMSMIASGALLYDEPVMIPATVLGVLHIIDSIGYDCTWRNAVVIGRSNIVGKPMALGLLKRDATVTMCHSKTFCLGEYVRRADLIVSAVGKPGLITPDMVSRGALCIDVGITATDNGLKGDFDERIKDMEGNGYITPVPGGVGLMTVAALMSNVVELAVRKQC